VLSVPFFLVSFILMDSSSESFGETESSVTSIVCLVRETSGAAGLPPDAFSSCVPHLNDAKVAILRLLVEACEHTLAECTNQLSKMMDDLKMKNH
jgi:hypothetical protein